MSMKTKGIVALFVALAIILAIQPRMIHNMYNTLLGRLLIIVVVIFFAMHNITLGLLVVLAVIVVSNQFTTFAEGLETMDKTSSTLGTVPSTIGDDNDTSGSNTTAKQVVVTRTDSLKEKAKTNPNPNPTISELKAKAASNGIDRETIKDAVASKPSNSLPITPSGSTENVKPSSSELSSSKSSLTEGFCPCAASVF